MKIRTEDEIEKFFMRDMKTYKTLDQSEEQYQTFKSVLLAIIAAVVLIGVFSKMDQDIESFKAEQAYKKIERE